MKINDPTKNEIITSKVGNTGKTYGTLNKDEACLLFSMRYRVSQKRRPFLKIEKYS